MRGRIAGALGIVLVSASVAAMMATAAVAQDSGFLKDYSQLEMQKDPLGVERRVWISPKFTRENYQKIVIERVTFFPAPEQNEQVTLGTLNDLRDYGDAGLRKAIASVIPLADKLEPRVARLRLAITAASVDKGLKPQQLVPVALVFTAATRASGHAKYNVKLFIETEITDSVTGEPLVRAVRQAEGVQVGGDEKLTLQHARPQMDRWFEATRQELITRFKPLN